MITGSQEYIRDMNRQLVLNTIIHNQPISRATLSKKLHLTKATISAIVQELLDQKLIKEVGSGTSVKGRKPILFCFHATCGNIISMDISPETITVMVSDLSGNNCILKEYFQPHFHLTVDDLSQILQSTISAIPETDYGVVGICMGIHGVVFENKIKFTPNYTIESENIAELLSEKFQIPVFVENEANLSVLGESAFHYKQKNIIYLSIHSGIGMGIMMDGSLFRGNQGYAGEIGHTILFPNGKPCPCGNRGCLEQYASEKAILDEYASKKNLPLVTIEQFIRDYYNNDRDAIFLINQFILYISIGINNMVNTLNPDIIIINSSFSTNIPGICKKIKDQITNFPDDHFELITSDHQDISELLGCVHICREHFLNLHSQIF